MAEDLSDEIATNAQGPRRVTGDSGSVDQHNLPDQIAADLHLASKDAGAHAFKRLGRAKLKPPGAS